MHIIVISGQSGSGKSIALNVVEDAGFYCVDNLPAPLLEPLILEMSTHHCKALAVVIDIRGGEQVSQLPVQIRAFKERHLGVHDLHLLFLDAKTDALVKRYSETRRKHPLVSDNTTLFEAIAAERERLFDISEIAHRIDTSSLKPNQLRAWISQFVARSELPRGALTLVFQSFGFKHGAPLDAELVFDVRCLLNPFYEPALRPLTGKDQPVIDFLEAEEEVCLMREDIARFITRWLPSYVRDHRSYLTIGIGCTGGQHRSVYIAEWLARQFLEEAQVLVRHRELAN